MLVACAAFLLTVLCDIPGDAASTSLPDPAAVVPAQVATSDSCVAAAVDDDVIAAVEVAAGVGLSGDQLITAVAIAGAESSFDPDANSSGLNANGSVDYGLWQINSVHRPPVPDIYDPAVNAGWMWEISNGGSDWSPWTVYRTGRYLDWVDVAADAVEHVALCDEMGKVFYTDPVVQPTRWVDHDPADGHRSAVRSSSGVRHQLAADRFWGHGGPLSRDHGH